MSLPVDKEKEKKKINKKKKKKVIVGAIGIENQAIERGSGMVDGWDSPSLATNNWWHEETQVVFIFSSSH